MPKLTSRLKSSNSKLSKPPKPVWQGPEKDGITQSLLSRFLVCRERFRLLVVEGLLPVDIFSHRLEYGQLWHTCEEAHAKNQPWRPALAVYARNLAARYRNQQQQVEHWFQVCATQFPIYVEYWSKHKDVVNRKPLLQEEVFNVPYELPSGRVVKLRGKWDSVDLIGKGKSAGVYLQENKTKGEIVEAQLKTQLQFDLQTMLYLTALSLSDYKPIKGVRYNVIRRPLSGGKGSIVQHKPSKSNPRGETKEHYYDRLEKIIEEDPGYFFMRWQVSVIPEDIRRFRQRCLDPLLEGLCDWWEWVRDGDPWREGNRVHWQYPYGVWNVLLEGGSSDLDEHIHTGSTVGLQRATTLFGELE